MDNNPNKAPATPLNVARFQKYFFLIIHILYETK